MEGAERDGMFFLDSQGIQNLPKSPLIYHISRTNLFFPKVRLHLVLLSENFSVFWLDPAAVDRR